MKYLQRHRIFLVLALLVGCRSQQHAERQRAPADPISSVGGSKLRMQGLAFARRGDLIRAQQYLSAAILRGADESEVVPELVKVCLASSRLRAALSFAQPYVLRHPGEAGMQYLVGIIHLSLGETNLAALSLESAVKSHPAVQDALFSLALIDRERGLVEKARRNLEQYLLSSPRGRYALRARRVLVQLGASS